MRAAFQIGLRRRVPTILAGVMAALVGAGIGALAPEGDGTEIGMMVALVFAVVLGGVAGYELIRGESDRGWWLGSRPIPHWQMSLGLFSADVLSLVLVALALGAGSEVGAAGGTRVVGMTGMFVAVILGCYALVVFTSGLGAKPRRAMSGVVMALVPPFLVAMLLVSLLLELIVAGLGDSWQIHDLFYMAEAEGSSVFLSVFEGETVLALMLYGALGGMMLLVSPWIRSEVLSSKAAELPRRWVLAPTLGTTVLLGAFFVHDFISLRSVVPRAWERGDMTLVVQFTGDGPADLAGVFVSDVPEDMNRRRFRRLSLVGTPSPSDPDYPDRLLRRSGVVSPLGAMLRRLARSTAPKSASRRGQPSFMDTGIRQPLASADGPNDEVPDEQRRYAMTLVMKPGEYTVCAVRLPDSPGEDRVRFREYFVYALEREADFDTLADCTRIELSPEAAGPDGVQTFELPLGSKRELKLSYSESGASMLPPQYQRPAPSSR